MAGPLGEQRPPLCPAQCVKLIMPWSTASMRFCTSELKTAVISRALVQRFPNQTILSVAGIRRQESPKRAKAPVAKEQPKLRNLTQHTCGFDWHPILEWTTQQVFEYLEQKQFPLHEAYQVYGSTRVSCCFCILSSLHDLIAAARCETNHEIYRALVRLEAKSTFPFQPARWLGDVAAHLLSEEERSLVVQAKERSKRREAAESRIPEHLLYTEGWPRCVPTPAEACLLCDIRQTLRAPLESKSTTRTPNRLIGATRNCTLRRLEVAPFHCLRPHASGCTALPGLSSTCPTKTETTKRGGQPCAMSRPRFFRTVWVSSPPRFS